MSETPSQLQSGIKFTVFYNENGPVGKEYEKNPDGSVKTIPHGDVTRGQYRILSATSGLELLDLRAQYGRDGKCCFTYGTFKDGTEYGPFTTKDARYPGAKARCDEDQAFRKGEPGWFFGDIDMNGVDPRILAEKNISLHWRGLDDIFCEACPEIAEVCHVWTLGNSACLYDEETGAELKGLGSYRLFFAVDDASRIPDVMAHIYQALWKAGYGFIKVSIGQMGNPRFLDRSLIDSAVAQPSREDFLAPILRPGCGIVRKMPEGLPFVTGEKPRFDTTKLPSVDLAEWRKTSPLLTAAKLKARAEWELAHPLDLTKLKEDNPKASDKELRAKFWDDVDAGVLPRDYPLVHEDGTPTDVEVVVQIAVMCGAPVKLRDVDDPTYDGGRQVAQAYYNPDTDTAFIYSIHYDERYNVTNVLRALQMEGKLPAPQPPFPINIPALPQDAGQTGEAPADAALQGSAGMAAGAAPEGASEAGEGAQDGAANERPLSELADEFEEKRETESIAEMLKGNTLIEDMNRQFALIKDFGGKAVILREVTGLDGKPIRKFQAIKDFHECEADKPRVTVERNGRQNSVPGSKFWQASPKRRTYESRFFDPKADPVVYPYDPGGGPKTHGYLNMWQGFAVKPRPGDWSLFRKHIKNVVASGFEEYDAYIFKWMAWGFQNPGELAEVAMVLRGEEGAGKGILFKTIREIYGDKHGLQLTNDEHMTGRFNGHLEYICFIFADEAFFAGDKRARGSLYARITETSTMYEHKGITPYPGPNRTKVAMASNLDWVCPAGPAARRWAVFDVLEDFRQSKEYFAPLYAELANGGREAMLHDMLKYDLQDWHPRDNVPQTEALRQQKELSLSPALKWLLDILEAGVLPGTLLRDTQNEMKLKTLQTSLEESAPHARDINSRTLSTLLPKWGCKIVVRRDGRDCTFPPLPEIRGMWERRFGARSWSNPTGGWGAVYPSEAAPADSKVVHLSKMHGG